MLMGLRGQGRQDIPDSGKRHPIGINRKYITHLVTNPEDEIRRHFETQADRIQSDCDVIRIFYDTPAHPSKNRLAQRIKKMLSKQGPWTGNFDFE